MIKCKILPPSDIYIPVIPARINNKLIFTLCSKCALEQTSNCNHSTDERALTGTWVSLEINKAIEIGYKIIKIYEIWNWNETDEYNPIHKNGGLFTEYIDMFLKGKQEASGYPDEVKTEIEKDEYIKKYYEKEGVLLDKNNIKLNSGMRTVTKLMLNSF